MPRHWRLLTADGSPPLTEEDGEDTASIDYKGKALVLCQVTCYHLYQLALPYNKPTARSRWEQDGVDFGERWIDIYRLRFKATSSIRLQILRYRIVQR